MCVGYKLTHYFYDFVFHKITSLHMTHLHLISQNELLMVINKKYEYALLY